MIKLDKPKIYLIEEDLSNNDKNIENLLKQIEKEQSAEIKFKKLVEILRLMIKKL